MRLTSTAALLLSPALVVAQGIYGGPAPGPTTTAQQAAASAPATNAPGTVNVNVAPNGNFVFSPNNFTAPNGTIVTFFFPNAGLQHSVTQSSFADPCTPLAASGNSPAGFDTGMSEDVQFSLNITNDQEPIWFFCRQVTHCGLGMVGAINPPTSGNNTFANFMAAAQKIGPANEPTVTGGNFASGGVGAIATAAASNTASGSGGSSSGANRIPVSGVAGLLGAVALGMLLA